MTRLPWRGSSPATSKGKGSLADGIFQTPTRWPAAASPGRGTTLRRRHAGGPIYARCGFQSIFGDAELQASLPLAPIRHGELTRARER
jgi:hypothetical protein